jgi:hypothetical protein
MSTLVYFAIQPRPVPKIKLSQFESQTVLVNSVILRLREEIIRSPLLMLGVESDNPESIEIWKLFLRQNQDPQMHYDVIVADQFLSGIDDIKDVQKLDSKEESLRLISGLDALISSGKRVVILTPTIYSVQMIPGNVANKLKLKFPELMSLSMSDFPRSREEEKHMGRACIVAGVDVSGAGPFGCLVMQTARANYLKRFVPGSHIGLVDQIGLKDYLLLYRQETQ